MIGGSVAWTAESHVGTSAARQMASRAAGGHLCAEQGPIGFFGSIQTDRLESTDGLWIVADLDAANMVALRRAADDDRDPKTMLAALYRAEGPAFLQRLPGAFALGLWDSEARTLLLAVDRFGLRQLHYAYDGRRIAFASRPTALLAVPGVAGRLSLAAIYSYLNAGHVPAPRSIFIDIARLQPGQCLRVWPGGMTLQRYGDVGPVEEEMDEATTAARVYAAAEGAVRTALTDARPEETGVCLGGARSAVVGGLMGRITGEAVNAFSIGFQEPDYDGLPSAKRAARRFRARLHEDVLTADAAFAYLPRLVDGYDEPFGGNAALGRLRSADLAHECGVSLLLAGDGGNHSFGPGRHERPDTDSPFFSDDGCDLLAPDFCAAVAAEGGGQTLARHDGELLSATRTAELAGVAIRFPLMDQALVDCMAAIPARHRMARDTGRALFERAFANLGPDPTRANALPFRAPTGLWLRRHRGFRELARDVLLSPRTQQRGYFRRGALARLFELDAAHPAPFYGDLLWMILMLELWHRRHFDTRDGR